MALPWTTLDRVLTETGETLELRRRGTGDFLITIGTQILMNSKAQRSEIALGKLGCQGLQQHPAPRVLVGGLGMAITLRAVLDQLPTTAEVIVAELNPSVHSWCLGPLADLTAAAAADLRVEVVIVDVAELIRRSPAASFDAVILDLYRGPHPRTDPRADPLYGSHALEHTRNCLKVGGTLAIWGENPDTAFEHRLTTAGFSVRVERPGKGGYRHAVWVARKKG